MCLGLGVTYFSTRVIFFKFRGFDLIGLNLFFPVVFFIPVLSMLFKKQIRI